jgi:hypothetical protein
MARDRGGFEQGRRRDEQGRPLKLQTPPPSEAYRKNWDRIFGKEKRVRVASVECATCGAKLVDKYTEESAFAVKVSQGNAIRRHRETCNGKITVKDEEEVSSDG